MARPTFDSVSVQAMPALRDRAVLISEVSRAGSGLSSDIARAALAEIELAISNANADYDNGAYAAALEGLRRARGLVYRLLHPRFDVSQWLRDQTTVELPIGAEIENALLTAGARLIATLQPQASDGSGLPALAAGDLDVGLARFARAGFRKAAEGDEQLEVVATQALSLMADAKPELAVTAMQEAIETATANGASPHALASTRLNLAAALLQTGAVDESRKQAAAAADGFRQLDDEMGTAQAIHAQAVGASIAGDSAAADELFAAAQNVLGISTDREPPATIDLSGRIGTTLSHGTIPSRISLGRVTAGTVADGGFGRTAVISASTAAAPEVVGLDGWSPEIVDPIRTSDPRALSVRLPGRLESWQVLSVPDGAARSSTEASWLVGVPVGDKVLDLSADTASALTADDLRQRVYSDRTSAQVIGDLHMVAVDATSTSTYLAHLYGYSLPLRIADCLHAMGLYEQAEASYLECTSYSFLNAGAEATAVWVRLARNAIEWGNTLYKALDLPGATAQYAKLIAADGTEPTASILYSSAALAEPATAAREVILHLRERPMPVLQWQVAQLLLSALSYLQQLADGLDFYGLALFPIYTFEYLQDVARGFAQEAIQAEREYVNFRSRQQIEEATRRDLETTRAMAWAEASGRQEQYLSAQADVVAAQTALALAVRRRDDAQRQRDDYADSSWTQIWSQAASTAQGMGSNSWFNEISELADKLDRGESISGERGKLAAAYTFQAGRRTRLYELAKMDDNIRELNAAIPAAQAQVDSAGHRAAAAEIAWQAAIQRAQMADASLAAFDANEFTAEAWSAMADVMRDISRDYLWRAIRLAKLMERAYNFEHDSTLAVIKDDYGHAVANASGADAVLLGGDGLLVDIESFTYVAITTTLHKQSRIKDIISLAREFPAHFEQFRQTGVLSFETDLYEFDRLHPGFYQQRIEAVEVEFVGLVPEEGLNGTLAAGGVTRYRKRDGDTGQRVHQVDTMALSDFVTRNDVFLYQAPTGVRGQFQGIGVASTWELRLPKRSNDFDFRRIIDVRVVVYYTALFDAGLRSTVIARPPRDGELAAVRDFNLRYDAPDAWYGFYRTSAVDFVLDTVRLPANQQDFVINDVQLRVQPRAGTDPKGIKLKVTPPGGAAKTVTTDEQGAIDLSGAVPALAGTSPIGTWHIELTGGASVLEDGAVQPSRITTMQLGLDYSFALPDEEP